MSRLSASCWMMSRGVLIIGQPIVWIPFLTLMVVLNVALSPAQADVSDVSVDRKVEQISANGALKSYVEEASRRFLIPSVWIWAVMSVESAGEVRTLSHKGAIGLMQIMPDTWTMLRQQHSLGDDPYDPRDNILAGASYLRDLHQRYGEGGFLAAYNAGPGRYEEHLRGRRSLPAETIDYVSKVSRLIGSGAPSDGFLRAYSGSGVAESDLFVRPAFESSSDQETDDSRFNNHVSVSPKSDQNVIDLSAITPQTSGLFVRLSDRRQLNQD
jgi:Transglycosylase SLT domain